MDREIHPGLLSRSNVYPCNMLREVLRSTLSTVAVSAAGLEIHALTHPLLSASAIFGPIAAIAVVLMLTHAYAVITCIQVDASTSPKQTSNRNGMNSLSRICGSML